MKSRKLHKLEELKLSLKRTLNRSASRHYSNLVRIILPHHIDLEVGMETTILLETRKSISNEFNVKPTIDSLGQWLKVARTIKPLLNELTFSEKLKIIRKRNYLSKEVCSALEKVNKHRNNFAHDRFYMSNEDYDINTDEGLDNVLDLYENVKIAHEGIDKYWVTWMRKNRLVPIRKS